MFNFLRLQYQLGHITQTQLRAYIPRWLTKEQVEQITREVGYTK